MLTATNATRPNIGMTKGYSIFYEGTSTAASAATAATIQETTTTVTPSGSLPLPPAAVRQVFDSFELIAAQEVEDEVEVPAVEEEQSPAVEEEDNNSRSDDLIDVDDFLDDLFDRLGLNN